MTSIIIALAIDGRLFATQNVVYWRSVRTHIWVPNVCLRILLGLSLAFPVDDHVDWGHTLFDDRVSMPAMPVLKLQVKNPSNSNTSCAPKRFFIRLGLSPLRSFYFFLLVSPNGTRCRQLSCRSLESDDDQVEVEKSECNVSDNYEPFGMTIVIPTI